MDTCFVIQPFDKDKFDKRYDDVYKPAIELAGLDPYRVDKDPTVRIPINEIEENIKKARICFAEITTDNPNVWYELGFAFASKKDVVMICSEDRELKFPFDIQHRHIIRYKTGSSSDFDKLRNDIIERLKAYLQKEEQVQNLLDNPVKESEGLQQYEVAMILLLLENQITEGHTVSAIRLQKDMEKIGFTKAASNFAFRLLKSKKLIQHVTEHDETGEPYTAFKLSDIGEEWIIKNQHYIQLKRNSPPPSTNPDVLPF